MSSLYLADLRTYLPPVEDGAELALLKAEVRARLDLMLRCMARIHASDNKKATYAALAAELHGMPGLSAVTLKRDWLAFKKSGCDWRSLLCDYHRPDRRSARGLPAEFVAEWRRRAENNQRFAAPAHRRLIADWRSGATLPGYGTWQTWFSAKWPLRRLPASCPPDLPHGWSYENLLNYLASEAEITVLRDGFFSAHSLLPQMARDRSQLRFLEVVAFDDFQADFRVAVPELGQVCKLIGLAAQCIGSAVVIEHAVGAARRDDDDHRKGLVQADMRLLLHTLLSRYGLPQDYFLHLLVENATAAIAPADELLLQNLSAGRIRVIRTALHKKSVLPGGWGERFGSPWQKGWLEATFSLFHNEAAALPGQFGLNQLEGKTGTIDALTTEVQQLYKAAQALPLDVLSKIRSGVLTETEAKTAVREIFNRINHREDHRLQGFQKITRWRLRDGDSWMEIDSLPQALRDLPGIQIKAFVETPIERMARLLKSTRFAPLSPLVLIPLLNEKRMVKVTRPYQIVLTHKGQRRIYHLLSECLRLEGTPFVAVFDERDMSCLHLHDEGMAYKCTVPVLEAAPVLDNDAIKAAVAKTKEAQAHLLKSLQSRHVEDARQRVADLEYNNALIGDALLRVGEGRDELTAAEEAAAAMASAAKATQDALAKQDKRATRRRASVDSEEAELLRAAAAAGRSE